MAKGPRQPSCPGHSRCKLASLCWSITTSASPGKIQGPPAPEVPSGAQPEALTCSKFGDVF